MKPLMGVGIAVALLALAGCTRSNNAEVRQDVKGMRQSFSETAQGVQTAAAEAALASKVKAALSMRKGIDARAINVEVHGNQVTLKGDVRSRDQADLVEKTAQETQGVGSVDNQLALRIPAKSQPPSEPATAPVAPSTPSPSPGPSGQTGPGAPSSGGTPSGNGY